MTVTLTLLMSNKLELDGIYKLLGLMLAVGIAYAVLMIPSEVTYEKVDEVVDVATSTDEVLLATTTIEIEEPAEVMLSIPYPLKHVCACESLGNPYAEPTHYAADGSVLRGRINPRDVGICQINLDYHEATARAMGLDLMSRNDNITYAVNLHERQGLQPWAWSQGCWGQAVHN